MRLLPRLQFVSAPFRISGISHPKSTRMIWKFLGGVWYIKLLFLYIHFNPAQWNTSFNYGALLAIYYRSLDTCQNIYQWLHQVSIEVCQWSSIVSGLVTLSVTRNECAQFQTKRTEGSSTGAAPQHKYTQRKPQKRWVDVYPSAQSAPFRTLTVCKVMILNHSGQSDQVAHALYLIRFFLCPTKKK